MSAELIVEYKEAVADWQPLADIAFTRRDAAFEARQNEALAQLSLAAAKRADLHKGLTEPSSATETAEEALEIAKEAHEAAKKAHRAAISPAQEARKKVDEKLRALELRRSELKAKPSLRESESGELDTIVKEIGE